MICPAGDELHLHAVEGGGFLGGAAVEADGGAGVLRGEADGFEAGDTVAAHLGEHIRNIRVPVTHPDVDREIE